MIYANYAATSPALKAVVRRELSEYLMETHLNAGRNFEGLEACTIALRARRAVAALTGAADPLKVILTSGATAALNMVIHGLARRGGHILATGVEHNATARVFHALSSGESGVEADYLPCAPDGTLEPDSFKAALKPNTRLLVISHASNVLGTIMPAAECFSIAREHGVITVLDAAQTAGVLPLNMDGLCDVLVFAGHKGLGGLTGIGGFALGARAVSEMRPFLYGGTGSASDSLEMPAFLPDRFEAGTQNSIGALSLAVSVEEILRTGVDTIREHERALAERFLAGLAENKRIRVFGTRDSRRSVAVVSLAVEGMDAAALSRSLFEKHGIVTRSGLHCSPLAHKTAGTFPEGTTRFSFGRATRPAEIDTILEALSDPR
jgi:cysteine desulfurase family protein